MPRTQWSARLSQRLLETRRSTVFVFGALTTLISVLTLGCSASGPSGGTPGANKPAESNAPQGTNVNSFSGPIVSHCAVHSKSTSIGKLNVDTGELVDIATFPIACSSGGSQLRKLEFSQDYRKAALPTEAFERHAKYYDSGSKSVVDVTNIIAPPSRGDFGDQQQPDHRNAQFDDQGLFVFYDARADEFDFFDTAAKKVVRTSKSYIPRFVESIADDPRNVPPVSMDS